MDDILHGDLDDPSPGFQGVNDEPSPTAQNPSNHHSSDEFEHTDPHSLFNPLSNSDRDVNMIDRSASHRDQDTFEEVCDKLQSEFKLDPQHLKIALLASKVVPEARNAAVIFANGAYHQPAETHEFDQVFKTFVRKTARILLLVPTIEAYSNNPHRNGALPKTLYYRTLDAIEKQPAEWKKDHLESAMAQDMPKSPSTYRDAMGELLKYQRSNLRLLLLTNILETKRITINGPVPNRKAMLTSIYVDLPPKGNKMTKSEIDHQVMNNYAMRYRMCYARLVMVYFYVHKSKKDSQWTDIDERLAILRGSSCKFQQHHSTLVLNRDFQLFSHKRDYKTMNREDFSVPTLEEVQDSVNSGIVPALLK
ncbi:hypothetical protein PGTUg99_021285 [Puccinia graminis f. sp. tritici]|uniref:Uncharacterized protein n=1 Tax=Puccinia graminis f. sp. tritici TaxID=56615 RepID=A0A5B0PEG2_PUCGR|nr:hypothetical protein PGTUg99_021285 [Puccinia graminis f. sp. tritici]